MSGSIIGAVSEPEERGTAARPENIQAFKDDLLDLLRTADLSPVPYGMGATAFALDGTPFREEPIVIDDGSMREFIEGRDTPILKVTVRPTAAEISLREKVEGLLQKHEIDPGRAQGGTYPGEGSVQYEIHRGRPTQSDNDRATDMIFEALGGSKRWWEFWK